MPTLANHVAAIRKRGDWILGLVDPVANGRSPADGQRLIQICRKEGLHLSLIENTLESGILNASQRMRSERLKVFASLTKYLEEVRLYRRDERDQIMKCNDHLQDAAQCLVSGVSRMRTKPEPSRVNRPQVYSGSMGWAR